MSISTGYGHEYHEGSLRDDSKRSLCLYPSLSNSYNPSQLSRLTLHSFRRLQSTESQGSVSAIESIEVSASSWVSQDLRLTRVYLRSSSRTHFGTRGELADSRRARALTSSSEVPFPYRPSSSSMGLRIECGDRHIKAALCGQSSSRWRIIDYCTPATTHGKRQTERIR